MDFLIQYKWELILASVLILCIFALILARSFARDEDPMLRNNAAPAIRVCAIIFIILIAFRYFYERIMPLIL